MSRTLDIKRFLYQKLLKHTLFRLDPEYVHNRFTQTGELLGSNPVTRQLIDLIYGYHGPDISKTVDGVRYKTPVLLSAGFDYNGRLSQILPSLGFGGEEIGSITFRPCEGNPRPRLRRCIKSRSLIVNKGLRNDGVEKIINRLKNRKALFVNGISIARTNDPSTSRLEDGIEDYFKTLKRLNEEGVGNYYTINISCPNAFGGEDFATPSKLEMLLKRLTQIETKVPVYVKMPINKEWGEFNEMLSVIQSLGLNGVIIGNLNKDYNSLKYREEAPDKFSGGLSGKPCWEPSNRLIEQTRNAFNDKLTIIGCGGIMSGDNAVHKFKLGADLVQLITGMIFEGPQLISEICSSYSDYLASKRPARFQGR